MNRFLKEEDFNRKNKWEILYHYPKKKDNKIIVRAKCLCGNESDVELSKIKNSESLSCGCMI